MYPNPVKDRLKIIFSLSQPERIVVYDLLGQVINSFDVSASEMSLKMQQLPQGIYLLHCEWKDQKQTLHKIIKP
ncbi:MAG: T9SS type A sorting domain-containing protein [Cyclobacteriaceae bacterium]